MKKVLILFAHPKFENSRANAKLVERLANKTHITFHDLYEQYPHFHIDVEREQHLLLQHDIIIWHHPFYWYSCPPLLKQWIDMVLEFKWAYGPGGNVLKGKTIFNSITTGGSLEVYCEEGRNHYTINEFLRPFEQTARLCGMKYLPPFAVMGTHKLSEEDLIKHADQYEKLIDVLSNEIPDEAIANCSFLNQSKLINTP